RRPEEQVAWKHGFDAAEQGQIGFITLPFEMFAGHGLAPGRRIGQIPTLIHNGLHCFLMHRISYQAVTSCVRNNRPSQGAAISRKSYAAWHTSGDLRRLARGGTNG